MPLPTAYAVGTVSVPANGTIVNGSGTNFLVGGIRAGDVLAIRGLTVSILSVQSATSLTLAFPWPGTTQTAQPYEIRYIGDPSRVLSASLAAMAAFEGGGGIDPGPVDWNTITNKPGSYPPSAHNHPWGQVTGKPGSYPPSAHRHDASEIDGITATPWVDITGKPGSYPPSAHTHVAAQITDLGELLSFKSDVGHRHDASEIDNLPMGGGSGEPHYRDIPSLLASTSLHSAGSIITTAVEGCAFEVVSSGADITTAGDIGLRVVPGKDGYNILAFGAVSGADDVSTAVTAACAGGNRTVTIPAGIWNFASHVRLHANTTVLIKEGAVLVKNGPSLFVNGIVGNAEYATGYEGDSDIHVSGGDYHEGQSASQGAYFQFAHCKNVSVRRVRCHSLYRGHYIEVNEVDGAVIEGNIFENQTVLQSDNSRDAINIDFSYQGGFPLFGGWDGTVCRNIVVRGNTFRNVQIGAGSHGATDPGTRQGPVIITGNVFENCGINAIWARYWARAVIRGNVVEKSGSQAFLFNTCDRITCSDNTIKGAAQVVATHAIQFQVCSSCVWDRTNVIDNSGYPVQYQYALRAFGGDGTSRISTVGAAAGSSGITSATDLTMVNDEWMFTLANNSAIAIPIPSGRGSELQWMIGSRSASLAAPNGLFYTRLSAGTLAILPISEPVGSTVAKSTGPLTGSTGAEGTVTISAAESAVHIENRRGSSLTITARPLGGFAF